MSELTLVERLRAVKKWITAGHGAVSLCDEAADEIERLQLELETQRDITDREYDSKCGWINEAARLRAAAERMFNYLCIREPEWIAENEDVLCPLRKGSTLTITRDRE